MAALFVISCERKPEYVGVDELGCVNVKGESCVVDTVGYAAGKYSMHVLSNCDFTVTVPEDADWLGISGTDSRSASFNGDCYVEFVYDINRSIPRNA